MDLAGYYRLLGLRTGASYEDIKAAYRRLARQYHPDSNPTNQQQAQEKFIRLTEAYKALISVVRPAPESAAPAKAESNRTQPTYSRDRVSSKSSQVQPPVKPQVKVTKKSPPIQTENLSQTDQKLKSQSYEQLQQLLKQQRFPRAIALIEGLAQRLPNDVEVRQWQAITYQRFGRYLVNTRQSEKARVYLKKALRTDPHNKSLWYEVEREFRRIEQIEIY
ncbi:J domain-containing protein [Leptolyngbya sp. NK1-12]|uniref:J domain-containing protein n=1 Tax=Leptolyngbya sp. NK1-12 TaxID=2547451 RepID=A0AA96WJW0_9CYAN|nr:J domain-containing protein [Leptolyngbya sp. NK1-12]WNZ23586.1 J domain-containing protein [Leptolyngbya sp. NK1-12]